LGSIAAIAQVAPLVGLLGTILGFVSLFMAFDRGESRAAPWPDAQTLASGLRVPSPFADALILAAVRETGGHAVSVTEDAMLDGIAELAARAGCFACPEGGATLAALESLTAQGVIAAGARVVLFNTGSGLKYLEAWRRAAARRTLTHATSPASSRSKGEDS
jgi:threonine synthase